MADFALRGTCRLPGEMAPAITAAKKAVIWAPTPVLSRTRAAMSAVLYSSSKDTLLRARMEGSVRGAHVPSLGRAR